MTRGASSQGERNGLSASWLVRPAVSVEQPIELAATSPYDAMIDHVLTCLAGHTDNLIEPARA
jgi:hypothetical protein